MNAALSKFYSRDYKACTQICSSLLMKDKSNESAWLLKMRAITEQSYKKDHILERKLSDIILNDHCRINSNKTKVSTEHAKSSREGLNQSIRPCNLLERHVTGALHSNPIIKATGSVERVIRSGKSRQTGRPRTTMKSSTSNDLNQITSSIAIYRTVVCLDPGHFEALASIGAYYYYEEQPEVALTFYRRILQLGFRSVELYNNLGLCSFYAQQYADCFFYISQALKSCTEQNAADVYFNVAHIAIGMGDLKLADQALRIALAYESTHPEAYNNLAVIAEYRGNLEMARMLYETTCQQAPEAFEVHHNLALLSHRLGDLQMSYQLAKKTLELFPNNSNMLRLIANMDQYFKST